MPFIRYLYCKKLTKLQTEMWLKGITLRVFREAKRANKTQGMTTKKYYLIYTNETILLKA